MKVRHRRVSRRSIAQFARRLLVSAESTTSICVATSTMTTSKWWASWTRATNDGPNDNLKKPKTTALPSAQRMLDGARANDRNLRVMKICLFYEPLRKLKEVVDS